MVMFMDHCELVLLISSLACTIAQDKSVEDISLLAAVFTQLGDTLATLAIGKDES